MAPVGRVEKGEVKAMVESSHSTHNRNLNLKLRRREVRAGIVIIEIRPTRWVAVARTRSLVPKQILLSQKLGSSV